MSKLAIGTLLLGLIVAAAWLYARYGAYFSGLKMESATFDGMLTIGVMLSCGALFAVCGIAAVIRAVLRKGYQPLVATIVATGFIAAVDFIPIPSYIDGVATTLSRQDERFYRDLEQRLAKLPKPSASENSPTIPTSWYDELPGLSAIFPGHKEPWGSVRIWAAKTHFDVFIGGSLAGTTGLRIYRTNETPEHLNAAEYVGAFREVYPRVYAYQRYY